MDGRPNRRYKAPFTNSTTLVRTGPDCHRSDSSPRLPATENAVFKFDEP